MPRSVMAARSAGAGAVGVCAERCEAPMAQSKMFADSIPASFFVRKAFRSERVRLGVTHYCLFNAGAASMISRCEENSGSGTRLEMDEAKKGPAKLPAPFCLGAAGKVLGLFLVRTAVVDFGRFNILSPGVDDLIVFIFVVMTDPGHRMLQTFFVAAFRGDVEKVVRTEKNVEPASVG